MPGRGKFAPHLGSSMKNRVRRPPFPFVKKRVSNIVVLSWNHVCLRVQAKHGAYLTWWPRAGTTCFHVSRPPRGYLTWASWILPGTRNGTSRVYLYLVSIRLFFGLQAPLGVPGPSCAPDDRMLDIPPGWAGSRVFTCAGHPGGYLTWWSRAGTICFYVSRPPRGVSNMIVPNWNHVFLRVQAAQRG